MGKMLLGKRDTPNPSDIPLRIASKVSNSMIAEGLELLIVNQFSKILR